MTQSPEYHTTPPMPVGLPYDARLRAVVPIDEEAYGRMGSMYDGVIHTLERTDLALAAATQTYVIADLDNPVHEVLTERSALRSINGAVDAVATMLTRDPQTVVLTLFYGALNLDQHLRAHTPPSLHNRIIPIVGERTEGTMLGTQVKLRLMDELPDASGYVLLDDLVDGGASHEAVIAALQANQKTRLEPTTLFTYESTDQPLNIEGAIRQQHVSIITPFTKNPNRTAYLARVTALFQPPLADIINRQTATIGQIDPNEWIMGQGIDTGIDGSKLRSAVLSMQPDLATQPTVMAQLNLLEGNRIRAGQASPTIIALNAGIDYERFVTTYATIFAQELQQTNELTN